MSLLKQTIQAFQLKQRRRCSLTIVKREPCLCSLPDPAKAHRCGDQRLCYWGMEGWSGGGGGVGVGGVEGAGREAVCLHGMTPRAGRLCLKFVTS